MPAKKRKTKGNRSSINRTFDVSHGQPRADGETTENLPQTLNVYRRESHFSGFLDGLKVTSSPGNGFTQIDERKRFTINSAEEQRRVVEDAINLRYEAVLAALERTGEGKTATWKEGDLVDVILSVLDANNADKMNSGSHGSVTGSRKVMWAETPLPREPTRFTRDTRRSKSVDPIARSAGNRTQRISAGHSYPELQTPSVTSQRFRFNIATVTPHPSRQHAGSSTSILRKPKFGETAISMAGSPLLVSSDHVSVPSVIVPLNDGRVFNVQGDSSSSITQQMRDGLDPATINQLQNLKHILSDLVP